MAGVPEKDPGEAIVKCIPGAARDPSSLEMPVPRQGHQEEQREWRQPEPRGQAANAAEGRAEGTQALEGPEDVTEPEILDIKLLICWEFGFAMFRL